MIGFLDMPYEIREQIYAHLLILPPLQEAANPGAWSVYHLFRSQIYPYAEAPLLHPAILSTCRQIYSEALPILYAKNAFRCHRTLLTSFPRLHCSWFRAPAPAVPGVKIYRDLTATSCPGVQLIRRWYLHARLDCGPFWDAETVAKAFTGAEEVELELYQSMFRGECGIEVLQRFEGVRGVRRVHIWGSTNGVEEYIVWLEGVMKSPVGSEVGRFTGGDA